MEEIGLTRLFRLVKVPVNPTTFKADVRAMRRAISSNTIMLYSSAPCFPQGVIDDIPALAKLAKIFDCGLHVDCCLGGFVLPFARKLGYKVPDFDFGVEGVTSMSCDTHKYGYAVKGTSVVMYANRPLRHAMYFCFPEWTGGLYATPTIAGSRAGALSAATWASMVRLGEEGYLTRTKDIIETTQSIHSYIDSNIAGLKLLGAPEAMIVCIGSDEFNIYRLDEMMSKRGWSLNGLQNPPCLHLCVTSRHVGRWEQFVGDLEECVEVVRNDPSAKPDPNSKAGIYGAAAALPAGAVGESLKIYMDVVLRP